MARLSDRSWVDAQYRDPGNFDARVRLYRYSQEAESWPEWVFGRLALKPGERVLEVGCGTANLWRDNAARLPAEFTPLLSDLSAGMIAAARERLAERSVPARYACNDAQLLPWADRSFDVAIANHMLYHVPHRDRALAELRRVLRSGGRCFVGTNDWMHLIELREVAHRFGTAGEMLAPTRVPGQFDVEEASALLAGVFGDVTVHRRRDRLAVTEASAVVDYLASMGPTDTKPFAALHAHLTSEIARLGSFDITTSIALLETQDRGRS